MSEKMTPAERCKMAQDICGNAGENGNCSDGKPCRIECVYGNFAQKLYSAGYRKQSVGEWKYNPNGTYSGLGAWECSLCGCKNNNLPLDEEINPLRFAGSKYCPDCGAKMKGGN